MTKLDASHLIDKTQELTAKSRRICQGSQRAKDRSKRLKEAAQKNLAYGRTRRERLQKKKAA